MITKKKYKIKKSSQSTCLYLCVMCALKRSGKECLVSMRKRLALINISFSLLLEFITVISGFIVPRLIIITFGSEVNGLVNSITSFIGYISVLQLGVGSVIKSSLYKPLAFKDYDSLNLIVGTTERFFRKIGIITIVYVIILSFIFPAFLAKNFDFIYTAVLVVVIGIGTIFTYLYGITNQMLLEADQKSYIYSIVQIITVICNTIAVVVLVRMDASIHTVKAVSTLFYVIRPIILYFYTKKKYNLSVDVESDSSVISQRWDGFTQGLAYYIHSKTDIFVLTIFSTFKNISIYGVYALVISGLNSFVSSIDKAVRSSFGNIMAKEQTDHLKKVFNSYNTCFHILCTIIFSTASITIFHFIRIYIGDTKDADYIQPLFGLIIIAAEYVYCLRLPYNTVIFAAGKFKETRSSAIIEAAINIVISVVFVIRLGLIGVSIGTLIAMIYRTISFIYYLNKEILFLNIHSQIKRYVINIFSYVSSILVLSKLSFNVYNYFTWIIYAIVIIIFSTIIVLSINLLVNKYETINSIKTFIIKKKKV